MPDVSDAIDLEKENATVSCEDLGTVRVYFTHQQSSRPSAWNASDRKIEG